MIRNKVFCAVFISILLSVSVFCQVGYSAETLLTLDDLPRLY